MKEISVQAILETQDIAYLGIIFDGGKVPWVVVKGIVSSSSNSGVNR
jgi:hypothetical protein